MLKEIIDPVFIMADNDARPLKTIDKSVFVTEDKYNAYYFYDLDSWEGAINPTSFDIGAKKAAKYLHDHGYSSLMFSSHMPQVIDKALFCEMLDAHLDIEMAGICEWSSYFNYLLSVHPGIVEAKPYLTLAWPTVGTEWIRKVEQPEFLFENFYDFNYEEKEYFLGFPVNIF